MVIHICCKLEGMRGPHSKHRLAIQLSKTELHCSIQAALLRAALLRTLATAGSRGRPGWLKLGRRIYSRRSKLSRGHFKENSAALPTEGPGYLHRVPFPVKLARSLSLSGLLRGGRFYPHSGFPVKSQVRLPVPSACEGRAM